MDALVLHPDTTPDLLLQRIRGYVNNVRAHAGELALLSPKGPDDKTQWKSKHKNLKKKGGRPPVDYSAIEMLSDLETALAERNVRQALVLYGLLNRILPY
jgi:hypothetical protein